ncbi:unnamed protein product [Owenia fusiformis]|uniref:Uncharacterized protein n=1 Tax=Owenia fusiformis TaxID=6347 RepID=A0A8J1XNK8_OWEFU|nr:unnamed protein product [Owenia fusiformis]
MYVIRGGSVHQQASQLERGSLSCPTILCCCFTGLVLIVAGGLVLGISENKSNPEEKHIYIIGGSIVLVVGFIVTMLTIFISIRHPNLGRGTPKYHVTSRSDCREAIADDRRNTMDAAERQAKLNEMIS